MDVNHFSIASWIQDITNNKPKFCLSKTVVTASLCEPAFSSSRHRAGTTMHPLKATFSTALMSPLSHPPQGRWTLFKLAELLVWSLTHLPSKYYRVAQMNSFSFFGWAHSFWSNQARETTAAEKVGMRGWRNVWRKELNSCQSCGSEGLLLLQYQGYYQIQ